MDVSMPIRSVIPTMDGPVLAALAATTAPARLTAVWRLTGQVGSVSGIRKALLRLVQAGIVDEVPGGYVLNRDHVAAAAIEQLSSLYGELLARIRGELGTWPVQVHLAGLFGSAARRDGDAGSDIDLLVVADGSGVDDLVDELACRVQRWAGNPVQVLAKSRQELRRLVLDAEPIVAEWRRDLVIIAGDARVLERSR